MLECSEARDSLALYGALLLRGTCTEPLDALAAAAASVLGPPLPYRFFVTPRRSVDAGFFTATDAPPAREVRFHNECSYLPVMPRYLVFVCRTPSATGGRTLVARTDRVAESIPEPVMRRFVERRLEYTWYLPSASTLARRLGCASTDEALRVLEAIGAEARVDSRGGVAARALRPAVRSARGGGIAWVNHAFALHRSSVPAALLDVYSREFGAGSVPHDVALEGGEAITGQELGHVGRAYASASTGVEWQAGDVLILDNLAWAHARETYRGAREIVVGMFGEAS